jgi:hypothetical protein
MSNAQQGLYPIIRRVRRPLIPTDAGTAATAVVPAKTPEPPPQPPAPKVETKPDATAPE